MFANKKIITFFNIFVILVLFCIFYIYNQSLFIFGHDRFHSYFADISSFSFPSARFPALIINAFYQKILPNLFGMHPQDFKDNYIVCSVTSIYFIAIVIAFTQGFFVSYKKQECFLFKKENIILLPCCFLILALQRFDLFCNFKDSAVFLEYHGYYIFYFLFFIILFQIILNNKPVSKVQIIFYSLMSFLLGIWSEFINIPVFLALLIIIFINRVIYRSDTEFQNILKNKNSLCIILSFLIGFIFFYGHNGGSYGINSFGTIGEYNIISHFQENVLQIIPFTKEFIKVMFIDYYIIWVVFISSFICLMLYLLKNPDKYGEKLLLLGLSMIAGFYITGYGTIIFLSSRDRYLFNMYGFPLIGYHIVVFVSLIILGYLYKNLKTRFLAFAIIVFLFLTVYLMSEALIPVYKETIESNTEVKIDIHNTEKTLIIYSIFGEAAIFPQEYNNKNSLFPITNPYKNKIYSKIDDFRDIAMLNKIYKHNIIGYQIYPEFIAKENLQKRIMYLGEIKPEYNIFKQIQYKDIKEYDKINLSMQKIIDLEEKYGKDDILQKAKAYLYFKQKDYLKALSLYSEYNKQNPEDYDALLNMAEIYKIQKDYDNAEKIYLDLYKRDNENLYVVYNLSLVFSLKNLFSKEYSNFPLYSYELYEEGDLPDIQFIKAMTYKKLGNEEKAEEIISKLGDNYKKEFYAI